MCIKDAVVMRFKELCNLKNIKYNELATLSGVTPSTVYSMMNNRRKDVSIITIKKLCDGINVSIIDFFNCDIFRNIDQEIK